MGGMNKTTRYIFVGLGMVATAHYGFSTWLPDNSDSPDAPPLAAVTASSATTASITMTAHITLDAITDAEYSAPAVDARRPVTITSTPSSVGAGYPGVTMFTLPRKIV